MEFDILLRPGVMNVILISSGLFNIQGREPYLRDVIKKNKIALACIQTFIDHFIRTCYDQGPVA